MKNKFSKHQLSLDVWSRINQLEDKYGFKSYNGWDQVHGKGESINMYYGEYECLRAITNQYDLTYTGKAAHYEQNTLQIKN